LQTHSRDNSASTMNSSSSAPVVETPYMKMLAKQNAKDQEKQKAKNGQNPASQAPTGPKNGNKLNGKKNFAANKKADAPAPILEEPVPLENFMALSRPHRLALLRGDVWEIVVGDKCVYKISKNLLMSVSKVAQAAYQNNPKSTGIKLPADSVTASAVQTLLKWLKEACHPFQAFLIHVSGNAYDDLNLIKASHLLGMDNYTHHVMKWYKSYIYHELPDYDTISAIVELVPEDHHLFIHLANKLCKLRYKKEIPDVEDFKQYLIEHPKLGNVMEAIDTKLAASRLKAEAEARQRAAEYRKQQKKQREQDAKTAEQVRQKLNGKNGSSGTILVVSAEEARFLKRR